MMLTVANKPIMLSVIILNVIMLSVVAPYKDNVEALPSTLESSMNVFTMKGIFNAITSVAGTINVLQSLFMIIMTVACTIKCIMLQAA
jgi:hypothetical protein